MEDFTIIGLFFLEMLLALLITMAFVCRCRFLNTFYQLPKKLIKTLKEKDLPLYYSTDTLKKIALIKALRFRPKRELVLSLMAMKNLYRTAPVIRRYVKKFPKNTNLLLLDAEISYLQHNQTEFEHLITQIKLPRFTNKITKAKYLLLLARNELYQTDMLSASNHVSLALKIYQKQGYSYEEAECYATLAQTYRISGVFDVSFTMLKEAQKIYQKLQLYAKVAEIKAYFGLIEMGRENYKTAESYFQSAANICDKHSLLNTKTDIKNWQGLIAFSQKRLVVAKNFFDDVLKDAKKPSQKTFAAEMLARIYFKQKKVPLALDYADKALFYAEKQNHYPGIFENLYLKAEIYYAQKDYQQCRKILTSLIKTKNPPSAIYYPANAYTLLGLVEIKANNLNAARNLFKQAIDLEHSQNRLKGAAIDYNNLAEISRRQGLIADAEKYFSTALAYAEELNDQELLNFLKSKK